MDLCHLVRPVRVVCLKFRWCFLHWKLHFHLFSFKIILISNQDTSLANWAGGVIALQWGFTYSVKSTPQPPLRPFSGQQAGQSGGTTGWTMPLFFRKRRPSEDAKKRLEYQLCLVSFCCGFVCLCVGISISSTVFVCIIDAYIIWRSHTITRRPHRNNVVAYMICKSFKFLLCLTSSLKRQELMMSLTFPHVNWVR